ncbi:zinc ribbon domain-containing protein [Rossellomorea aquimaris]|uniref:Zinc-ribbon domain-containing protein n=1 Tax=Rossellomorea aquimaris TaxID=189382 RepID=A0A5D4TLX5_9BACI|nr:zinc-ribbon domain-containing protein [Rossellomorea aquimaris]TYS75808.1 zinc-ribbon domain-containing protein [Rossellomorea aquimaris]
MKFCKNCGNELKPGQGFCTKCGHKQEEVRAANPSAYPAKHHEPQRAHSKKNMSKEAKFTWAAIGVTLLLLFGGHKFLENHYSPHKVLAGFEETIDKGNLDGARDLIDFTAVNQQVSDKDLKSYLQFLRENEGDVTKGLNESFSSITQGSVSESVFSGNGNELLRVMKDTKKKWGLYEQYKIEAVPFQLTVSANLPDVEVEYRGTKSKLKEALEISNILPGEQVIKGSYNGEYSEITQEAGVDFQGASNNMVDVFLEFEGDYVFIYSNEYDSTLFVNGKSTGEKIGSYYELGPLPVDGSIVLHAEYQGENGVITTAEAKVMNTDDVFLEFKEEEFNPVVVTAVPEDNASSIEEFMIEYINTSVDAMNEGDFSIVKHLLHPDGKSFPESKDYIDYVVSKGIKEDVLSIDMIDFEEIKEGYSVTMIEEYDIHYSDGTTNNKSFKSTYLVKEHDSQLKVWSLESTQEL